VLADAQKYA
jgi:translation initiation factor 5B